MSVYARPFAISFAFALAAVTSTASADVPSDPPTVLACQGKKGGDECDLSSSSKGTCQLSKCGTADCLECKQGATTTRPDAGSAPPASDSGGCTVGHGTRAGGAFLLALSVPAIVLRLRRRKRAR